MRKHNAVLLILLLLAGLITPWLGAMVQDAWLADSLWPLPGGDVHYAYRGTLLNRVLALDAHLNYSAAVERTDGSSAAPPVELYTTLSHLLPLPENADCKCTAFSLSPKQYAAEYAYLNAVWTKGNSSLDVIADTETGMPLNIRLKCAPDVLTAFMAEHPYWDLLHGYASILGYSDVSDGAGTISDLYLIQRAGIRGTGFIMTINVFPVQGILMLSLSASA